MYICICSLKSNDKTNSRIFTTELMKQKILFEILFFVLYHWYMYILFSFACFYIMEWFIIYSRWLDSLILCFSNSSKLIHVALVYSILLLHGFPMYEYVTIYLSILLLMWIWIVSGFSNCYEHSCVYLLAPMCESFSRANTSSGIVSFQCMRVFSLIMLKYVPKGLYNFNSHNQWMRLSIVLQPFHLDVDQFVNFCHSGECKIVFYYDINLHLQMTNTFRHLFFYLWPFTLPFEWNVC